MGPVTATGLITVSANLSSLDNSFTKSHAAFSARV